MMTNMLKKYLFALLPAVALSGCAEEIKQVGVDGKIAITAPDGSGIVTLDGNAHNFTLNVKSDFEEWDFTVDESSSYWCRCHKASESEIAVEVLPNTRRESPLVFSGRESSIEVFAVLKPEIKSSCTVVQSPVMPHFSVGKDEVYDFEVPFEGKEYVFDIASSIMLEVSSSDDRFSPELTLKETPADENKDAEYVGTLKINFPENMSVAANTVEVTVGNTVTIDGEEKEMYKTLTFTQGAQGFIAEFVNPPVGNCFYGGASLDIRIASPKRWTVASDTEGVSFSSASGSAGESTVTMDLPANMSDTDRPVTVTVSQDGTGRTRTLSLYQGKFDGIRYTSTNGRKIVIAETGMKVSSHVYSTAGGRIATKEPLIEISVGQFNNCGKLKSIALPSSVAVIENAAFSECYNLEEITMNKEMERMGGSIFYNCRSLVSVDWPKVRERNAIPAETFSCCMALERVGIPDGLVAIGKRAFYVSGLREFDFSSAGSAFELGEEAFYGCDNLESVSLPENLAVIPEGAFSRCSNLVSVRMGAYVKEIGDCAFGDCDKLRDIDIPASVTTIGFEAFFSTAITRFVMPPNVTVLGSEVFRYCNELETVDMRDSKVSEVRNRTFFHCEKLKTVRLPPTVTRVEYGACFDTPSLTGFYMMSEEPPVTTGNVFISESLGNALDNPDFRVYIPEGAKDRYSVAESWKNYPLQEYRFD